MLSKSDDRILENKNTNAQCFYCKGLHYIQNCPKFIEANISERYNILKKFNRCFSCTGPHIKNLCKSKGACQLCHKKSHHTLLHPRAAVADDQVLSGECSPGASGGSSGISGKNPTPSTSHMKVMSCHTSADTHVLLSTAVVKIRSNYGDYVPCRIIVDPGSQINFISNTLANKLGLRRRRSPIPVSGVGEATLPVSQMEVDCVVVPYTTSTDSFQFSARVIPAIVSTSPSVPLSKEIKDRFSKLSLADPDFTTPGPIDILFGAQLYAEILSDPPSFIKGNPSAILTALGWIIFGRASVDSSVQQASIKSYLTFTGSLHDDLKKFWETEEVHVSIPEDPEDKYCEQHFQKTIERDSLGRYVVSLPFKPDISLALGSTREIALQRFNKLESRFKRHPSYKEQYSSQMKDYLDADHIQLAETTSDYVLTHHGVIKQSSTTQLRVVFNGSEQAPDFKSLNEHLLTGPNLSADIGKLIDNFRLYPIALTCDVKQMFRCIRLHPTDRKFVHLFWRSDPSLPISEYEITTLPFGLVCSPFVAQRVVLEHFKREGPNFPHAIKCEKEIYMDNVVTGAASEEDALVLYEQLVTLFSTAGFVLRKFSSNNPKVLSRIPEDDQENMLLLDNTPAVKVLGLQWNPQTDYLCYSVNLDQPVYSKRGILSLVARIYDINGYISPVTFWIKCMLQRLWLLQMDWDDPLPSDIYSDWCSFLKEIPLIADIQIPRYILNLPVSSVQLVAFADASEKGYGCVTYIRSESLDGSVHCHLVRAKSKVAPLKVISIPRLELNAAVLLARVIHSLNDIITKLNIKEIFCFSDSKNVLCWLQTPPHKLKIYIANRVVQILNHTEPTWWNHIPSKMNPADCVSRGLTPRHLLDHSLYWQGPDFLQLPFKDWPIFSFEHPQELLELKPISLLSQQLPNYVLMYFKKFSSLVKLQRVIAFMFRFVNGLKGKTFPSGPLTSTELSLALSVYVRLTQEEYFSSVLSELRENKPCSGNLSKLTPFISSDGLLRVGGRLRHAPIPSVSKHPALVHGKSHLASLLCDFYHIHSLHGGPQLLQILIQFSTLLGRIEAALNSRPLCAISNHPSDNLDYLSPGHFLIGQPLLALPDQVSCPGLSLGSRWGLLSGAFRQFWKRWQNEYLQSLIPRTKWTQRVKNIEAGALVILRDRGTSPLQWTLARVVEVLPGSDGIVRVLRLKTADAELVRPVHKVVPLPTGNTY